MPLRANYRDSSPTAQNDGELFVEEADSSDAFGSGGEALRSVLFGDAAEGVDGNGVGGEAGFVQGFEAGGGRDELAGDGFSEDRGEEDGIGAVAAGDLNFSEGVAGDGDDGGRKSEARIAAAHVAGEQGRVGGKVDAVSPTLNGGLETAVDEQASGRGLGGNGGEDAVGEIGKISGEEIFFAELDKVDASPRPQGGLLDEGRVSLGLVAGKQGAVGDGAAEHVDKFSSRSEMMGLGGGETGSGGGPRRGRVVVFRQRVCSEGSPEGR
ncbi:hypothetical protein BDD14_2728 [Edaphobacter modestus]|uniref:Uncharacterized protein n=1 Tax=Edaphobacter modestus TaxID=388466 RepID=A0A4Q7YVW8_9BACT|nr:hypothetical protein BDD14_2728 [Edaphobacter modestus]